MEIAELGDTCSCCGKELPEGSYIRSLHRCRKCASEGIAKCASCGNISDANLLSRSRQCENCSAVRPRRSKRGEAKIDLYSEWKDDYTARAIVVHHPDGMTLDEVGEVLGVSRERVRQIETAALKKLEFALLREGVRVSDFMEHLRTRNDEGQRSHSLGSNPLVKPPEPAVDDTPPPQADPVPESPIGLHLDHFVRRLENAAEDLTAIMNGDEPKHDYKLAPSLPPLPAFEDTMTDTTDHETSRRDIEKNALMNPWTPEELAAIEPFVNDPRTGPQAAEEAIKDARLGRRNLNAITQKIIGVRRQRGVSQGGRTGGIAKADPEPASRSRSRRAAAQEVAVSSPGQAVSVLVQAFESQSAVGRETVLALVDYMIRLQDPELAETAARVARALRGFPLKDRERILNAVAMVLEVQGPARTA